MSAPEEEFKSPEYRRTPIFLDHVAGFEVLDADGNTVFVTIEDLERDADPNPAGLREILKGGPRDIGSLSDEYLLRNLVLPNLPIGFYGDPEEQPTIVGTSVEVRGPQPPDELEFARHKSNSVIVRLAPTLGRLASVSAIRSPQLGGQGMDWFGADRNGCVVSFYGGTIQAHINYM